MDRDAAASEADDADPGDRRRTRDGDGQEGRDGHGPGTRAGGAHGKTATLVSSGAGKFRGARRPAARAGGWSTKCSTSRTRTATPRTRASAASSTGSASTCARGWRPGGPGRSCPGPLPPRAAPRRPGGRSRGPPLLLGGTTGASSSFTEYEDTRRYLERCLREAIAHSDRAGERIAVFSGTTPPPVREDVKHAFNTEPVDHPLRILIATDAAREGLNLQRHCADLFHFDLPWNPSRLDQRNGRIDRKLQPAGEVFCRYFFYPQRPEDRVLKVLVEKAERIRAELGSAAAVLEGRVAESIGREGVRRDRLAELADRIEHASADDRRKIVEDELEDARARRDDLRESVETLQRRLDRSRRHIGLTAAQLRQTLSVSLRLAGVSEGIRALPGRRQRRVLAVHDRPAGVDGGLEAPAAAGGAWAGTSRSGSRPLPAGEAREPRAGTSRSRDPLPAGYDFKPPGAPGTSGAGYVLDGGPEAEYGVPHRPPPPAGYDFKPSGAPGTADAGYVLDGEAEAEYGVPHRPSPPAGYDFKPPGADDAGYALDGEAEAEYGVPDRPPPMFEFPAHRILVRDPGWTAALDTLRERRRRGESAGAWRRRAGVRPVSFEDTGRLGDKAVHLHLEHRVAQRLLSRFTAQGLIHHDLSKACLVAAPGRDTRVVLLGRLAVYGRHAARLHEEVVPVTARWIEASRRSGALAPYGPHRRADDAGGVADGARRGRRPARPGASAGAFRGLRRARHPGPEAASATPGGGVDRTA